MSPTRTTGQLTKNLRISALIFVMVVALVTILGKGGGGGGDTTAPTVSSTAPTDNSNDVARDTMATATFSEAMDAGTIDTTSFSLRDGRGTVIPAAVSLDMNTDIATLMPNQFLNLLTPYTATLSTAITDEAGNALAGAVNWSFRSEDGSWRTAELIEEIDTGTSANPQIAVDPSGNALAVWQQLNGMRTDIYSNRYTAGSGWGATPTLIGTGDFGDESNPQIAMDADGNALVVYQKVDASCCRIYAVRYTLGSGWDPPEAIVGMGVQQAMNPQVVIDANGNGIAVWAAGTMPAGIYSSRFTPGAGVGWSMAEPIKDFMMGGSAGQPQVAVDADGNALAVWVQQSTSGPAGSLIYSNRYTPGSGWATEQQIGTIDSASPQIAIDASGNGLAVWAQQDGMSANIRFNRYTAGMGWGMEDQVVMNDTGGGFSDPQIAMDADGNVLAVWYQSDRTTTNVKASHYTPGMGWDADEFVESGTGFAGFPEIAIDANGNGIAVWHQEDGMGGSPPSIRANRYTAGAGWGVDEAIETGDGFALYPRVAIDADGNAFAIWQQSDGMRDNIWTNRLQ
jgi:hypothetical protein